MFLPTGAAYLGGYTTPSNHGSDGPCKFSSFTPIIGSHSLDFSFLFFFSYLQ